MSEKVVNFRSCFDVIGPIMVGPSSSHTAGALQIGLVARKLLGEEPVKMTCVYYESFAQTHKGHGTDFAVVAGILGFAADDKRVPHALEIAANRCIAIEFIEKEELSPAKHANTADIYLYGKHKNIRLIGVSIGGGAIEVRYIELENTPIQLQGTLPILIETMESKQQMESILSLLQANQMIINNIQKIKNNEKQFNIFELQSLLPPQLKGELEARAHVCVLA